MKKKKKKIQSLKIISNINIFVCKKFNPFKLNKISNMGNMLQVLFFINSS